MESGCLAVVMLGIALGALIVAIYARSASAKLREELRQVHARLEALERDLRRPRERVMVDEAFSRADTLEKPIAPSEPPAEETP